ncbi:hypothetical protein [Caulobacter vibrioides]|uniref:Uncharacterized protein n=1 Tax=Caulobacter phage S2B TaxID=2759120 RepID=A0AAE7ML94_9CAUD|nr:hypothetical protein [Caulobacter vibrioides]QOC54157.1 hypothetical protein [Caulobacter phage S2B]QXZ53891.1 hypothetical protein KZH45_09560 [Caulobacter vibrioides]
MKKQNILTLALARIMAALGFVPAAELEAATDELIAVRRTARTEVRRAQELAAYELRKRQEVEFTFDRYREAVLRGAFGTDFKVDGLLVVGRMPEPAFPL